MPPKKPNGVQKKSFPQVSTVAVDNSALTGTECWTWNHPTYGHDERKDRFLCEYQRQLRKSGITDPTLLQLLVAQKIQEDGAFDPRRVGDNGCSLGYFQYNQCVHGKPPESFYDDMAQIMYMVERVNGFVKQHGESNYGCVIYAHNAPAYARSKKRSEKCKAVKYYRDVSRHIQNLEQQLTVL